MAFSLLTFALLCFACASTVLGASRTTPPSGALVVRAGTTTAGEFSTLSAAVASLPSDGSSKAIFIFPGTYNEQVYITRTGPLIIFGYTTNTATYTSNQVTIQAGVSATAAGNDDASGTLRIHKDDFKMYNVNVKNTFGQGSQALAISQYGNRATPGRTFCNHVNPTRPVNSTRIYSLGDGLPCRHLHQNPKGELPLERFGCQSALVER